MDLYRLVGRTVIACIITSVIAAPLGFLFLNSIGKNSFIIIVMSVLILVAIRTLKKNR